MGLGSEAHRIPVETYLCAGVARAAHAFRFRKIMSAANIFFLIATLSKSVADVRFRKLTMFVNET